MSDSFSSALVLTAPQLARYLSYSGQYTSIYGNALCFLLLVAALKRLLVPAAIP